MMNQQNMSFNEIVPVLQTIQCSSKFAEELVNIPTVETEEELFQDDMQGILFQNYLKY
jgi:hypothetical protein